MNKYDLRKVIGREEFSYQSLMVALKHYKAPLQKLNELLKSKQIIRVKKGLYVIAPDEMASYNPLLLSNLIYGPSYISFETALSYWGLIPERVETIQSVTCKRNKEFITPVGRYTYRYLNLKKYRQGVILCRQTEGENILIATPEKALMDYITLSLKKNNSYSFDDIIRDLRVDEEALLRLVKSRVLKSILKSYKRDTICYDFLSDIEERLEEENNG